LAHQQPYRKPGYSSNEIIIDRRIRKALDRRQLGEIPEEDRLIKEIGVYPSFSRYNNFRLVSIAFVRVGICIKFGVID